MDRRRSGPTRALGAAELGMDVPIREKTLWTMLYETAARSHEVLALDIKDLDRRNRRSKVTRKGAAADIIVWQTGTARLLPRLLPRLLDGRTKGPVFLTGRRARVALSAADVDPVSGRARLSYRRAEEIFTDLTRPLAHPDITDARQLAAAPGWTLHQLRHSALTRAAENGANTGTLLAYSGHSSVASLARYTRASPDALSRWQAQRDPHRRR
jgi:integrase/recombinase XerC/integrase/recombinase XerD